MIMDERAYNQPDPSYFEDNFIVEPLYRCEMCGDTFNENDGHYNHVLAQDVCGKCLDNTESSEDYMNDFKELIDMTHLFNFQLKFLLRKIRKSKPKNQIN